MGAVELRRAPHLADQGARLRPAPRRPCRVAAARPPARKTIHDQELADLMDETFAVFDPASDGSPTSRGAASRAASRSAMACVGVEDLDRRHAHRRGRLEVDAEVVEEHALGGFDAEQLAGDLVEARLGLAARRPCSTRRRRRSSAITSATSSGPSPARRRRRRRCSSGRRSGSRRRSRGRARSTISGRTSPDSRPSTSAPGTSMAERLGLVREQRRRTRRATTSLRSSRAHAFVSGLVALTERMKSAGRPCSASYRLNASNGLDRMTPPKSQSTARIMTGEPTMAVRQPTSSTLVDTCGVLQPTQEREVMTSGRGPAHVVVDGSNIATEGPLAAQPRAAQRRGDGFMEEHPDAVITVVVDATFGHRIDKKEVAEFDAGGRQQRTRRSAGRRHRARRRVRARHRPQGEARRSSPTTPSRSSTPTTSGSSTRVG